MFTCLSVNTCIVIDNLFVGKLLESLHSPLFVFMFVMLRTCAFCFILCSGSYDVFAYAGMHVVFLSD